MQKNNTMKRKLFTPILFCIISFHSVAQVTQINSNKSLSVVFPLTAAKTILTSALDSSIWVTDGTLAGTVQLSTTIFYDQSAGLLNGKLIFTGRSTATGNELFITDGTAVGTVLLKDINTGMASSDPGDDFAVLNGFIYFTARRPAEGRELWRTDGTAGGTTLVKDIVPGADSSNAAGQYNLFSTGTYLLFAAKTPASGIELWKSDGTSGGTAVLKDIYAGADSSKPGYFYLLNNTVLFTATDATHGEEIWKTDGTAAGTTMVKDINVGPSGCTSIEIFPGFSFPVFQSFHTFNNRVYFIAYDGTSTGELWSSDGTTANTTLIKDIVPGTSFSFIFLSNAVNLSNKFIFPVSDGASSAELWQSDGTPGGTVLFKAFSFVNSDFPFIMLNYIYDVNTGTFTNPLFQGNKFFFTASTDAEGRELWISDGTLANTKIVKDINPGVGNGADVASYAFSTAALYFSANDAVKGNELWKTDGTLAGTNLEADINVGADSSNPELSFFTGNGKLIFGANNGDNAATDLYVLGGVIIPPSEPCPGGNISLTSSITGAAYQWQVNTGGGFSNITNNATYAGATTVTLQINNAPSSFYGYQYRCNVSGNFSTVTIIKFVNNWKGSVNNLWNNPANWSCNVVPDGNTDVVINAGTAVLNVNGTCRSIAVSTGANFTANTGFTLQVMH